MGYGLALGSGSGSGLGLGLGLGFALAAGDLDEALLFSLGDGTIHLRELPHHHAHLVVS